MVKSWNTDQNNNVILYNGGGHKLDTVPHSKIVGSDWKKTVAKASQWVSDNMAQCIADHFYFRDDQQIIAFLKQ